MLAIIVAEAVVVEAELVKEAIEDDLVAESVDVEYRVEKAEVIVVAVDKKDIMEMKGINLTLTFPVSRIILT